MWGLKGELVHSPGNPQSPYQQLTAGHVLIAGQCMSIPGGSVAIATIQPLAGPSKNTINNNYCLNIFKYELFQKVKLIYFNF